MVTMHHLSELEDADFPRRIGLVIPRQATKALCDFLMAYFQLVGPARAHILQSNIIRHSRFATCAVNDVVLLRTDEGQLLAGQIWACASVLDEACVVLHMMEVVSRKRRVHLATFRFTNTHAVFPVEDILDACIWTPWEGNLAKVLLPHDLELRM